MKGTAFNEANDVRWQKLILPQETLYIAIDSPINTAENTGHREMYKSVREI